MPLRAFIKSKIGEILYIKKNKKIQRKRFYHSLKTANTFGILLNSYDTEAFSAVRSFYRFLTDEGKKIKCACFVLPIENYVENNVFISPFLYFSEKDFDIRGKPKSSFLKDFINTPFDILIDVRKNTNYFIDYVLYYSQAALKIGCLPQNSAFYDLFVDDYASSSNPSLYLENVKEILKIMNYDSIFVWSRDSCYNTIQ
mgnify:CR=1 FL=1